ncbi:hypothetical protein DLAC_03975 [Tieghemostelium lacteum]|uniref:Palmitoyltransferase n=1 Tax=Tieghemostelium lacteum TaxID=361077 RepID=A0A151ZRW2_TIELA|nr:hypothetical protein DLAC_03975 [Tieghemostelium lacteum]|eukprot:KYQ96686.1 hypothetical protein DLAC_03975 [Tieghemostelium lacteum]
MAKNFKRNKIKTKKREKRVIYFENGNCVSIQYCKTCNIQRPPRSSHCGECDRCVLDFDHHCPWIGNCVGRGNYKMFCYFVWSTLGVSGSTCVLSLLCLVNLSSQYSKVMEMIADNPVAIMIFAFALLLFWTLIGLSGYHLYLVSSNITTKENLKGHINPYNPPDSKSQCYYNLTRFLFISRFTDFPEIINRDFEISLYLKSQQSLITINNNNNNNNINNNALRVLNTSTEANYNDNHTNSTDRNSLSSDNNSTDTIININDENLNDIQIRNRALEEDISSSLEFDDSYEERERLIK